MIAIDEDISLVCIIGFRGVGKTTLGQIWAKQLRFDFWDSDCEIEKNLGMRIINYAKQFDDFREQEFLAIKKFLDNWEKDKKNTVITLGAGFVEYVKTFQLLEERKEKYFKKIKIIHLVDSIQEIYSRLEKSKVKRIQHCENQEELKKLFLKRYPFYEKVSHTQVNLEGKIYSHEQIYLTASI